MNERKCLTDKLIEFARNRTTISYTEAGKVIDRSANNIWRTLDEISQSEHQQGRAMLPAVVIVSSPGVPGYGFFTCAPDPDVTTSIPVQRGFWGLELGRVYDYWTR